MKTSENTPSKGIHHIVLNVTIVLLILFATFWSLFGNNSSNNSSSSSSSSIKTLDYSIPFCSKDGSCGEESNKPTPRTVYSARSKKQYEEFMERHANLSKQSNDFATTESKSKSKSPIVFLGDSITEGWMGTSYGTPIRKFDGVPQVFDNLATELGMKPLNLGVSGDQIQHLWWRCLNGNLPPALLEETPNVTYIILIGTNNLGSGILPGPTSQGLLEFTEWLLKASAKGRGSRVLLMELLPRGDNERVEALCPPRCSSDGKPFSSFMPAINTVNLKIEEEKARLQEVAGGKKRFQITKCDVPFFVQDSAPDVSDKVPIINEALMPDRLHPNAAGYVQLGKCIKAGLESFGI